MKTKTIQQSRSSLPDNPAGLMSGHQQALLSLIAKVTQQMQICSRPYSYIGPASGHQFAD